MEIERPDVLGQPFDFDDPHNATVQCSHEASSFFSDTTILNATNDLTWEANESDEASSDTDNEEDKNEADSDTDNEEEFVLAPDQEKIRNTGMLFFEDEQESDDDEN